MKKTGSLPAVLLAALVLLSCASPAFAAGRREVLFFANPEDFLSAPMPEDASRDVDWDALLARLRILFFTDVEEVEVRDLEIPFTEANEQYLSGLLFYEPTLLRNRDVGYEHDGAYFTKIRHVTRDAAENTAKYEACVRAIDKLLYGIRDNDALSDVDKALLAHDRLAVWAAYDYENLLAEQAGEGEVPPDSYSPYGPLGLRTGVCNGIALAYGWLLDELGIENYYVSSRAINHGWTKVILDGEAYYVDPTWDDPVWDVPGRVKHTHFMLSFPTFSAGHRNASDFDQSPSSTIYEDYFSQNSETEIVLIGDKMYYLDARSSELRSRDAAGNETVLTTLPASYVWPDETDPWMEWYIDFPCKITAVGDEILYLAPREVRAYNVVTGRDRLVHKPADGLFPDPSFFLVGLQQIDGTVYVTSNNSTAFDADTGALHTESFVFCTHPETERRYAESPATCAAEGFREEVVTCKICREELSRTKQTLDKLTTHTPGAAVKENAVAATCAKEGSYDEVVYCTVCKAELSRTKKTTAKLTTHTPGAAGKENAVAATCAKEGSYDEVVYCTVCKAELSRTKKTTAKNPAAHTGYETRTENEKAATYQAAGYTGDTVCAGCGAVLQKGAEIPRLPVPKIDAPTAKQTDAGIVVVLPQQTAATLLAATPAGATLTDAAGKVLAATDPVGSGAALQTADGARLTVLVMGDNDGDGYVKAADARNALRAAVGLENFAPWQITVSLVGAGDKITAAEARLILRGAVGLEDPASWYRKAIL